MISYSGISHHLSLIELEKGSAIFQIENIWMGCQKASQWMCSIQQKQALCKQIKWCRNPLHKMIGEASMLTLYASQVSMYFDGWPPTPDVFIIFQHVGRRLHWSDDSYKTANKEYGHSGNRWPFICTGKVNLVPHQSILCSRVSCFEKYSDRSNRESCLPQTVTFFVDQTFQAALLFMLDLGQLKIIPLSQTLHCWLQIIVSALCQSLMEVCQKVRSPGTTISHTLRHTWLPWKRWF